MSYHITSLDDGHILVLASHADFEPKTELPKSAVELIAIMDAGPDRVAMIIDTRLHHVTDFNQILESGAFTLSEIGAKLHTHPKLVKEVVVTSARVIELMFKGLDSETFGFLKMNTFESMDEALQIVREALAQKQESQAASD